MLEMGLDRLGILQAGLWIVLLVLLAIVLLAGVLGRKWRLKTLAELKFAGRQLRQLQELVSQGSARLAGLSPDDPEPFVNYFNQLQPRVAKSGNQLAVLNQDYAELREQSLRFSPTQWWMFIFFAPAWFRLRRQASRLGQALQIELHDAETIAQLSSDCSRLGWEIALQARQVYLVKEEADHLFERLHARGFHGIEFQALNQRRQQARDQLTRIKFYFFNCDEEEVLELAQPEDISDANACLESVKPELEQVIAMGSEWENRLAESTHKVQALQRRLAGARRVLGRAAAQANLPKLQQRLAVIQSQADDMQALVDGPEVERLAAVSPAVEQSLEELAEIQHQAGMVLQDLASLSRSSGEIENLLAEADALIEALANHPRLPIEFNLSRPELDELRQRNQVLGRKDQSLELQAIQHNLAEIQRLSQQTLVIKERLSGIGHRQDELLEMGENPAIKDFSAWQENSLKLIGQCQSFAPENFAAEEDIKELPGQVDEQEKAVNELINRWEQAAIPEFEVLQLMEAGDLVLKKQRELDGRLQKLQLRLTELEQVEQQARNAVADAQTALSQLAFLARSNPFLAELTRKELPVLQADIENARLALDGRGQGIIADKARLATTLAKRTRTLAGHWLGALGQETQSQGHELSAILRRFDAIAPVEEGVIDETRRVLASLREQPDAADVRIEQLPLTQLISGFKQQCDLWQRCTGLHKRLLEIETPLSRSYDLATESREGARGALNNAVAWLRQRRYWPPSSVRLAHDQMELDAIEQRWQALHLAPVRAIQLVQQLGELTTECRSLRDRVQASLARAADEMGRGEELEADIAELRSLWQSQWQAYRREPAISDEIKALLDEIDRGLKNIRNQYRRNAMDYEEVMAALKSLYQKMRFYQIELDPGHALDVMGNIHRR